MILISKSIYMVIYHLKNYNFILFSFQEDYWSCTIMLHEPNICSRKFIYTLEKIKQAKKI